MPGRREDAGEPRGPRPVPAAPPFSGEGAPGPEPRVKAGWPSAGSAVAGVQVSIQSKTDLGVRQPGAGSPAGPCPVPAAELCDDWGEAVPTQRDGGVAPPQHRGVGRRLTRRSSSPDLARETAEAARGRQAWGPPRTSGPTVCGHGSRPGLKVGGLGSSLALGSGLDMAGRHSGVRGLRP